MSDRDHNSRDRNEDRGWLARWWNFIDDRDIDKHVVAVGITIFFLIGTIKTMVWAAEAAKAWLQAVQTGHAVAGSDMALVIGAVLAPWSLIAGIVLPVVIGQYFRARA